VKRYIATSVEAAAAAVAVRRRLCDVQWQWNK